MGRPLLTKILIADFSLRPIVIDGPNIAMAHGSDQIFSITGIEISVRYFIERGHKTVVAFIPQHYQTKSEDRCVCKVLIRHPQNVQ